MNWEQEVNNKVRVGMSREDVIKILGEPTDTSMGTRKYPTPAIYKYGDMELYFSPWKSGRLQYWHKEYPYEEEE